MQSNGREIDVQMLAKMRADGSAHTLLDIREPEEIEICAIADSLTIHMQEVPEHIEELPRDRPLIVMCHRGGRSAVVTDFLRESGFENAWNLAGGIDSWARLMDPGMERY